MSRFAIALGVVLLVFALAAAPVPLTVNLENAPGIVVIYPNVLFAVPLILLGVLLLLYGATSSERTKSEGHETRFH